MWHEKIHALHSAVVSLALSAGTSGARRGELEGGGSGAEPQRNATRSCADT